MEKYKDIIVDFIEGRTAPEAFYIWFESNPQVLDWLQSMVPQDKTIREPIEVKVDYFLKDLPESKQGEIYEAYKGLCETVDVDKAKKVNKFYDDPRDYAMIDWGYDLYWEEN